MIINKNKILASKEKKPILFDAYYHETEKPQPLVIFCHGYKGFKDWGAWHLVLRILFLLIIIMLFLFR